MRITKETDRSLDWRDFGTFFCEGCQSYFSLRATQSGLLCCPLCGGDEANIKTVLIGEAHEDNDIDDDYGD